MTTATTTRDGRPVTDTRIYRVTPRGIEQIAQWMAEHYTDAAMARFTCDSDIAAAVNYWAKQAEQSQNGEIELVGIATRSGRPAYLTPEREAVKREYAYRTDSEAGTIYAIDFKDACDQLDAMVPAQCIADGGWGWVGDCDHVQPRYEIGQRGNEFGVTVP